MSIGPAVLTAGAILFAFVASVGGTWLVRAWLEKRRVVDLPNERSLHQRSTVTGGGAAVSMVLVLLWIGLSWMDSAPDGAILIPIIGLSLIGLMDDFYNLPWAPKLVLQLAVAVSFVSVYGPFTRLDLFGLLVLETPWINIAASMLWIVAMVNIYNFMDGIDGLGGGYGALTCCVLGLWFAAIGDQGLSVYLWGGMAACLGFLVWNWAPAKIFLGDTGSMLIGGVLAAAALMGQREHEIPVSAFVLLYAVFIADTTYTLGRRARRGEKLWQAHKEHVYQRVVQCGLGHAAVTGIILAISAIIGVLASLEMSGATPRLLWLAICLAILWTALIVVKKREKADL